MQHTAPGMSKHNSAKAQKQWSNSDGQLLKTACFHNCFMFSFRFHFLTAIFTDNFIFS